MPVRHPPCSSVRRMWNPRETLISLEIPGTDPALPGPEWRPETGLHAPAGANGHARYSFQGIAHIFHLRHNRNELGSRIHGRVRVGPPGIAAWKYSGTADTAQGQAVSGSVCVRSAAGGDPADRGEENRGCPMVQETCPDRR